MSHDVVRFRIHGVQVEVRCVDEEVRAFVARDFSYFRVDEADPAFGWPQVRLRIVLGPVPLDRVPEGTIAIYHTKDAIVYAAGGTRYFVTGRDLLVIEENDGSISLYASRRDALFERAYLLIMTHVGDLLDRNGLHRIHAMGVTYRGRGVVCVLPAGGGKTTLTLGLLENDAFGFLSEEVPLVSRPGWLHPFPIRLGVRQGETRNIPDRYLRSFTRNGRPPKTLIDADYVRGRVAPPTAPGFLFVGRRVHASAPEIRSLPARKGFAALAGALVAGVGLPQLLEYLLRFDWLDGVRHAPILWSRIRGAWALTRRSRVYELRLGYDRTANVAALTRFLAEQCDGDETGAAKAAMPGVPATAVEAAAVEAAASAAGGGAPE